eukprot:13737503-Alexandrium_andersonii.AAC.1
MASWALHGPSFLRADSLACLAHSWRAHARPGRSLQRGAPVVDIDRRPCGAKNIDTARPRVAAAQLKQSQAWGGGSR